MNKRINSILEGIRYELGEAKPLTKSQKAALIKFYTAPAGTVGLPGPTLGLFVRRGLVDFEAGMPDQHGAPGVTKATGAVYLRNAKGKKLAKELAKEEALGEASIKQWPDPVQLYKPSADSDRVQVLDKNNKVVADLANNRVTVKLLQRRGYKRMYKDTSLWWSKKPSDKDYLYMGEPSFDKALQAYVKTAQDRLDKGPFGGPWKVGYEVGPKFVRVFKQRLGQDGKPTDQRSIYTFVAKGDGEIYKAASWNKRTKRSVGNIFGKH